VVWFLSVFGWLFCFLGGFFNANPGLNKARDCCYRWFTRSQLWPWRWPGTLALGKVVGLEMMCSEPVLHLSLPANFTFLHHHGFF